MKCGKRLVPSKQEVGLSSINSINLKFCCSGALNGIKSCVERQGSAPAMIVTHSSGNHGQAVAWAAGQSQVISYSSDYVMLSNFLF